MAKVRKTLWTWQGRAQFQYDGSVQQGTTLYCGHDFCHQYAVTAAEYQAMLARFSGQEVSIGTSRTNPPDDSLGKWFTVRCKKSGITSYIGPILIEEGLAERGTESDRIRIGQFSN